MRAHRRMQVTLLHRTKSKSEARRRSRPRAAVNSPRLRFPVLLSLRGAHLLGDRLIIALVSHPPEPLALELSELDAVGGVADVEIKHGPDQREAAGLAREPADHLGAALDLAERSLEQVGASPPATVAKRVAKMDDERVQVVVQAFRGGGVAGRIELLDQSLQSLPAVALVDGLVK